MSGRWKAVDGQLIQPDGYFNGRMHDGRAADIAARLNGPSPAEVAALLRSVEWDGRGPIGEPTCPECMADALPMRLRKHADDCKLDAMIKQCEGA